MKNKRLQLSTLWKKGTTLTLGLGLLSGGMNTQAATDCNTVTDISAIECESLLELYYSTNGAQWFGWNFNPMITTGNDGWNVTNTPCSWHGITCRNGGVTGIVLRINLLTGTIPDFSALPNLLELDLGGNQLTGTVPDFSTLPNLGKLDLSNNQLTGEIPNFSALPHLRTLELHDNQMTGTIPDFSALPHLKNLDLGGNQLTSTIPNFSTLPNLEELFLSNNQLTGTIPDFNALPNLESFTFSDNQLTLKETNCNAVTQTSQIECESLLELYHSTNGVEWEHNNGWKVTNFPCAWYGITCKDGGVTWINLSSNRLTGAIPDFSALPNLRWLELSSNQLTGTIPDFNALPNLESFAFSGNQLTLKETNCNAVTQTSKIECESLLELYHSTNGADWRNNEGWNVTNTPCSWYSITCENGGITGIHLSNNQLTGTIPNFSALPNLQKLVLSRNQLTGAIPDFSALPNLQKLQLDKNQLTSAIPDFSTLPNLQKLALFTNRLTGAVPDFSTLPNLRELYLYNNQLTGVIPDFSTLPNLRELYLYNNQLTGAIPDFSALPNLQRLYLSTNQLTGAIPDFGTLPHLQTLDLESNQLTGAIPSFSASPNLQGRWLFGNKLCKDTNLNYFNPFLWEESYTTFPNCPVSPTATVKMQLNQNRYTTDDSLQLEMQVNGQAMADLYVAIVFPDGDLMTIAYPLSFSWLNAIQIYQPAVEIAGEKTYLIMDFPLPAGITTGIYNACGVLVLAGKEHIEDNWIDSHCAGFEVY